MKQTFGEFIREKRTEKMFKLNVFAKRVEISNVYLSYIETGKRPAPAKRILERMAKVLELDSAESCEMFRLAAATHSKYDLPQDVAEYLSNRPYLIAVIRYAEAKNYSEDRWMNIMKLIDSEDNY